MPRITVIAGRGHNPSATRERQQGPDFCPGAQEAGSHPEGRRMWREAVAAVGGGGFEAGREIAYMGGGGRERLDPGGGSAWDLRARSCSLLLSECPSPHPAWCDCFLCLGRRGGHEEAVGFRGA